MKTKDLEKRVKLAESRVHRIKIIEQKESEEMKKERVKRMKKKIFLQSLAGGITGAYLGGMVPTTAGAYAFDKYVATTKEPNLIGGLKAAQKGAVKATAVTSFVLIAFLISLGVYERFLSKAGKSCNQFSGRKKTICMYIFHIKALDVRIADLKKAIPGCRITTNPEKCRQQISKKIEKLLDEKAYYEDIIQKLKAKV